MTGAPGWDLAFAAAAAMAVGGGLSAVLGRSSPLATTTGYAVATSGVAWACGLAGAPLIAIVQAGVGLGVALCIALFGIDWVGTGRDPIPAPRSGRIVVRASMTVLAAVVLFAVARAVAPDLPALAPRFVATADPGAAAPPWPVVQDPLVVATLGLILMAAIVGGAALAARERPR